MAINNACPASGWAKPSGTAIFWADEVTEFSVTDSVESESYGHDKSQGWKDVTFGTRSISITLSAKFRRAPTANMFGPGHVCYLELEPFGPACSTLISGYAGVKQVGFNVDVNTGATVGYSMTLLSKGPWHGVPESQWGGFECACGATEGGGSGTESIAPSVGAGEF
jgi:hypothetical protein